jgi:hypothetical protein
VSQGHESGEGRADTLRPDRILEVRVRTERMATCLYRSRSGEWLTTKAKAKTMLYWAAALVVIVIVVAVFSFGGGV